MPANSESSDPIVIAGSARTPIGALLGELSGQSANELGAVAVRAALERSGVKDEDVDQIVMGCVLPAGQGQAPARQAALKAGLPMSVEATTLNKMCGSGMQAVILARGAILAGDADVIVAGGMESMSNAPHMLPRHRTGVKYGHDKVVDHMACDGLEDAYEGKAMGVYADMIAQERQLTREAQDAYALETLSRAQRASEDGAFASEIVPVKVKTRKGEESISSDELPRLARPEKIPSLRPAFSADGTVTAANASAISDGASAMVLMRLSTAERLGVTPEAKIVATAAHAHEPAYFTTAPGPAMAKALEKAGWKAADVDLFEVNEAFAVVPMLAMAELSVPHDVVNVNGGACALGHPIGASGARIMATLLGAMKARDAKRGLASLCIGGGEATAVALERM
ncbi:MAG: acetyl-CoA C-acyltransferase [Maricaulaceae bacterium]|jgi:acetyl-CoA C-acetyltransferase